MREGQLQAYQEEKHDNPELCDWPNRFGVTEYLQSERSYDDPCNQVAEDCSEIETPGHRDHNNCRHQQCDGEQHGDDRVAF